MFINKTFLLGNTQKRKKTGRLLLFGKFPVSRLSQSVSLVLQFLSLRNLFGARDALKQKPRQRLSTYGKFPTIRSIPFFSSSSMKGSVLDKSVEVFNVKSTGIWICDKTKYKETLASSYQETRSGGVDKTSKKHARDPVQHLSLLQRNL